MGGLSLSHLVSSGSGIVAILLHHLREESQVRSLSSHIATSGLVPSPDLLQKATLSSQKLMTLRTVVGSKEM